MGHNHFPEKRDCSLVGNNPFLWKDDHLRRRNTNSLLHHNLSPATNNHSLERDYLLLVNDNLSPGTNDYSLGAGNHFPAGNGYWLAQLNYAPGMNNLSLTGNNLCRTNNNHHIYLLSLYMARQKAQDLFDKRIFWDVDVERLDIDKRAAFVIERVFERGDVEDIRNCRRYYGDGKVKRVLLVAKFLPEHRLHLAAAITNTPIQSFRCYILKQLNPGLSPY